MGFNIVLSSPSGAGKTTITKKLSQKYPNLKISISHTTRKPRSNEIDGVDYYFKSKDEFEKLIREGLKISHDEYHRKYLNKFEGTLKLRNFTPRIFEAIICKSCLVLVEGEYNGILKKDINYIPIKKDFSNIEEVYNKIRNFELCKKIADHNYKAIIKSGDFTYQKFIDFILSKSNIQVKSNKFSSKFKNLISLEILINEIIVNAYFLLLRFKIISALKTLKNFIKWEY